MISCLKRLFARRRVLFGAAALSAMLALSACGDSKQAFKGSDITGSHLGKSWSLAGTDGKSYSPELFQGKVTLVFFGFTQCPDICPTALAELNEVMRLLGNKADKVQIVMITVDPERDTPEVMKAYVAGFNPKFLGLTGTVEQVKQAAGSFKAYFAKSPAAGGNYTMDHSASFYLMDSKGESRVLLGNNVGAATIAHDIEALIGQ